MNLAQIQVSQLELKPGYFAFVGTRHTDCATIQPHLRGEWGISVGDIDYIKLLSILLLTFYFYMKLVYTYIYIPGCRGQVVMTTYTTYNGEVGETLV